MSSPSSTGGPPISGPPYQPQAAQLGGFPNNSVDTPISAVFIVLFIIAAIIHMTILQINMKREHRFLFSGLLFGLSMSRILALVFRIVWANRQTNASIAVAAIIFTNAGVLILFIVNMLFARRIIRSYHPNLTQNRPFNGLFTGMIILVVCILLVLVGVTIPSFYTLNRKNLLAYRDVLRFAAIFFAVLAFLPIPLVYLAIAFPGRTSLTKFGSGRWRTKLYLLVCTSALLTVGAVFRAIIPFFPRPINNPAWYHSRACYYCFIYLIEIVVSLTYAGMRFDKRFHVPVPTKSSDVISVEEDLNPITPLQSRINTEGAIFGGESADDEDRHGKGEQAA